MRLQTLDASTPPGRTDLQLGLAPVDHGLSSRLEQGGAELRPCLRGVGRGFVEFGLRSVSQMIEVLLMGPLPRPERRAGGRAGLGSACNTE